MNKINTSELVTVGELVTVVDADLVYSSYTDFMDEYGDKSDKSLFNPFRDIYNNDIGIIKSIHYHLTEPKRLPLAIVNNGRASFIIGIDGLAPIEKGTLSLKTIHNQLLTLLCKMTEIENGIFNCFDKKNELPIATSEELTDAIYPLTIVKDRYNGVYSGGKFIAWNLYSENINPDSNGSDLDCFDFWKNNEVPYGKGETIEQAVADLYFKLKG